MVAILDVGDPIPPAHAQHIGGLGGMTCQADTEHRMTLGGEILAHPEHFFGGTGEAVDQQAADPVTGKEEWFSSRNDHSKRMTSRG